MSEVRLSFQLRRIASPWMELNTRCSANTSLLRCRAPARDRPRRPRGSRPRGVLPSGPSSSAQALNPRTGNGGEPEGTRSHAPGPSRPPGLLDGSRYGTKPRRWRYGHAMMNPWWNVGDCSPLTCVRRKVRKPPVKSRFSMLARRQLSDHVAVGSLNRDTVSRSKSPEMAQDE